MTIFLDYCFTVTLFWIIDLMLYVFTIVSMIQLFNFVYNHFFLLRNNNYFKLY